MKLVLIRWFDSYGCSSSWTDIPESLVVAPLVCESVGWLAHDGTDCKVILPHRTTGEVRQGCGDFTIPACAIKEIIELVES